MSKKIFTGANIFALLGTITILVSVLLFERVREKEKGQQEKARNEHLQNALKYGSPT